MAEVGTYYITIMPEMSHFTNEVKSALGDSGKAGGKSFGTSFGDIVKGSALGTTLGNLASKAGGMIAGGFSTGISRLDTIKNYPKVMESLGYSTSDADKSIRTIMGHLDGLPTATQDMVTLTQSISDSTGDLDLATAAALGFNDMMLANGASAAEVATAQGVLNRVLGKGSATAAQWQSLTSVMPAQLGMVAKSMLGANATTEDLHTALEDGAVGWNDFLQAIAELDQSGYIDENGKKLASFEEQARANSHGIGTAIDNVKNRIGAGWASILDVVGQEQISGSIDKMSYGIKSAMGQIANAIGWLKDTLAQTKIADSLGKIGKAAGEFFQGLLTEQDVSMIKDFAKGLIDLVDGALQWLADHGDVVKVALGGILGIVSGLVGLSIGTKLAALPGLLTAVWTALSANPFFAIATLVAGLVVGLYTFFTQTEEGKAIWEGFCQIMSDLWTGLQEDWQTLCNILSREWESFKAFIDGIPEWWQGIVDYWTSALEEQKQNFAISWQKIKDDFAAAWESIKQAAINTWNGIKDRVTSIVNGIKTTLTNIWNGIKTTLGNIWTEITKVVTHEWDAIKNAVGIIVNGIKTKVTTTWDNIKTAVGNTLANLKEAVSTAWDNVKTSVGEKVDGIKTAVSDKFTAAKDTVLNIFNDIKSGITDKIDSAREKIAGIVDRIKNLFNFSWSLPAPKLPHITWSWTDIGGIVSIPSFGIDWYAKGGVFDSATLIGIGEKGREAALPLNSRTYREIAKGIEREGAGGVVITGNNFYVREELDIDRIAESLNRKVRRERMAMA